MNKEEKEYLELKKQIELAKNKVDAVKKLEEVESYLELKKEYEYLKSLEESKYTKMQYRKYMNCKHLFVCTNHYQDIKGNTSRRYFDFGCLKCGLNTLLTRYNDRDLTLDEKINKSWCQNFSVNGRVSLNMDIDLELATAIYKKLKEKYPYIDEDRIIKYLEIAVDNMRNINVTEERKQSRIKRLNLSEDFYSW